MKTILTIICVSLFALSGATQTIKITKNEVDEFTGSRIVSTKQYKIARGADVSLSNINDVWYLYYTSIQASVYSVMEGDELMLKHQDGSVTTLKSIDSQTASSTRVSSTIIWSATVAYQVDQKQIELLFKKPVAKIRQNLRSGYDEREPKGDSQQGIISKEIAAVLQALREGPKK